MDRFLPYCPAQTLEQSCGSPSHAENQRSPPAQGPSRQTVPSPCPHLSGVDKYFCFWNFFSRPMSCSSVKMVRLRRGFFCRGVGCSVSDSLLPWFSPAASAEVASAAGWWDRAWATPGVAGTRWGMTVGCRVITERRGYARREAGPGRQAGRQVAQEPWGKGARGPQRTPGRDPSVWQGLLFTGTYKWGKAGWAGHTQICSAWSSLK